MTQIKVVASNPESIAAGRLIPFYLVEIFIPDAEAQGISLSDHLKLGDTFYEIFSFTKAFNTCLNADGYRLEICPCPIKPDQPTQDSRLTCYQV